MTETVPRVIPETLRFFRTLEIISLRFIESHGRWAERLACQPNASGGFVVTLDLRDGHRKPVVGRASARFADGADIVRAARREVPIDWHLEEFMGLAEALRAWP
jgi:hypothetical protein